MSTRDTHQATATETAYVRKWPDADARDRGDLPEEIVVITQVSTYDGASFVEGEGDVEIATEPERIAALNPVAIAYEERARAAQQEQGGV